jgi:tetratricopeptide (TPR) repeat protein
VRESQWPLQALTERDYVLLTDFTNTTGDSVFDGTLKQALAVKLEESPFLNILPEQRVREALRFMNRSPDERITSTVGREICVRENVKAMMTGEIALLGSRYVVALNAVNCATGESLAREQTEAESKEDVLAALGRAASSMRGKLGESLNSIQQYDTAIQQATTSSLEALKAYNLGNELKEKGDEDASIPFFERAIELDPNFASAYARLGTVYGNRGEAEKSIEYKKRAYGLRDRVSEPERLYITSHYYLSVTGEIDKEIETYQVWLKTYPRADAPLANLTLRYNNIGQYEKALEIGRRSLEVDPDSVYPYANLGGAYLGLNRLEEAKAILQQGLDRGFDTWPIHAGLHAVAFLERDTEAMNRHTEWGKGTPGEIFMLGFVQANAATYWGKLGESRKLNQRAIELSQRYNLKELSTNLTAIEAATEAMFGNFPRARTKAKEALAGASEKNPPALVGLALALAGELSQAESFADKVARRFPTDTVLNTRDLPSIRAIIDLKRGDPAKAVERLKAAAPYELGGPGPGGLFSIYLRGQAYLQAGASMEAAAEFQKIIDHPGVAPSSPLHALTHLALGQARKLAGDTAAARRAYQDFLALWKDADPDLPILREAKAEYAKLEASETSVPAN